jgi:uncharacterized protein
MKIFLTFMAFVFCFSHESFGQDQSQWQTWKDQLETSYVKKFASPTYTHHIYLNKSGESAFIDFKYKYPRFVKNKCGHCQWSLLRNNNDKIIIKSKKTQIELPFEKETLIPGESEKYISAVKDEKSNEIRIFLHDLGQKKLENKRKRYLFPYNKNFIYQAKFQWLKKPKIAKIQRSDGSTKKMPIVAQLEFKLKKQSQILSIYKFDDEDLNNQDVIMLIFRDKSNGKQTYGAGRFLNLKLPKKLGALKDGAPITVDFNYSYNPPCAVSTGFHCPLPQDLIQKEIIAGEKYIKH